ncbi:MAG: hypothetical protein IPN25_10220 [Sphingobacteriales bacterium]|nr:hypothetical protein [Sphingobacteriales bacterium]
MFFALINPDEICFEVGCLNFIRIKNEGANLSGKCADAILSGSNRLKPRLSKFKIETCPERSKCSYGGCFSPKTT